MFINSKFRHRETKRTTSVFVRSVAHSNGQSFQTPLAPPAPPTGRLIILAPHPYGIGTLVACFRRSLTVLVNRKISHLYEIRRRVGANLLGAWSIHHRIG